MKIAVKRKINPINFVKIFGLSKKGLDFSHNDAMINSINKGPFLIGGPVSF